MKISIRFFNDKEVRAAWNEENNKYFTEFYPKINKRYISKTLPENYFRFFRKRLRKSLSNGQECVIL